MITFVPSPEISSRAVALRVPAVPGAQRRLGRFANQHRGRPEDVAKDAAALASEIAGEPLDDSTVGVANLAFGFVLSLLADSIQWGAVPEVIGPDLWVVPPDSTANQADDRTTAKKNTLRDRRTRSEEYAIPDLPGSPMDFLRSLESLSLEDAASSRDAADAFRSGVSTWSMPYRGREGRARRLVLFGESSQARVPLGLLEVGDDAPLSTHRDALLGFARDSDDLAVPDFCTAAELRDRFRSVRQALRQVDTRWMPSASVEALLPHLESIRAESKGRNGHQNDLSRRKSLAYLSRLAAAEAAALGLRGSQAKWVKGGLRSLRDLTVPRIHTEATICGALPPFGAYLVGKLVAMMFAHPSVRAITDRPVGVITSAVFDAEKVTAIVPHTGVLLVTTKGLWPGHSAQYNRVTVPGNDGFLPLRHVGDTRGLTASHLSDRTMRLATQLQSQLNPDRAISRVYGSGGGKRQRTIETSATSLGLPRVLTHAAIERPVYALSLAGNLERAAVLAEQPDWDASPYQPAWAGDHRDAAKEYETRVLGDWSQRWLPVAERRSKRGAR